MGYSHYWQQHKSFSKEEWGLLVESCRILFENLPPTSDSAGGYHSHDPLVIGGASGERSESKGYVINQKEIAFNGQGDSPEDEKNHDNSPYWGLACETFMLRKIRPRKKELQTKETWGMDFCKTNRLPYDLVVCSVLLMARAISTEKFEYEKDTESSPSAKKLLWSIHTKLPEKMQALLVCDTFRP